MHEDADDQGENEDREEQPEDLPLDRGCGVRGGDDGREPEGNENGREDGENSTS